MRAFMSISNNFIKQSIRETGADMLVLLAEETTYIQKSQER